MEIFYRFIKCFAVGLGVFSMAILIVLLLKLASESFIGIIGAFTCIMTIIGSKFLEMKDKP